MPRLKNAHAISPTALAARDGYSDASAMLYAVGFDSVVPACCDMGCETEPDGTCAHGCPSLLLALGVI